MAASQNPDGEKEGSSELVIAPLRWGTALSAVKDQIPSMDSDLSFSEGDEDEELFIFQRDQSNLIPDFSEELEDLPLEEEALQKTYAFMKHPTQAQNPKSPASQEDRRLPQSGLMEQVLPGSGFLGALTEESQQATDASGSPANEQEPGKDVMEDEDALRSSPDTWPSVEMPSFSSSLKERRKLIETKILSKAMLRPPSGDEGRSQPKNNNNNVKRMAKKEREPGASSAEHPKELTLFAFKEIEKWDLDKVLQNLEKKSDHTSWIGEPAFPSMYQENSRAISQAKLMGKLEELSLEQSRAFFAHRRRYLAKLPHFSECQGDGRDIPILAPLPSGQSPSPMEVEWAPEPPTVYLDLRDAVSQEPGLTPDAEESLSDSSTDEEENINMTDQEKIKDKMNEFLWPSRKNCTGKSFLLQQLRNLRKMIPGSGPGEGRGQDLRSSKKAALPNVTGRCSLKGRDLSSTDLAVPKSNAKGSQYTQSAFWPSRSGLLQDPSANSNAEYPRT